MGAVAVRTPGMPGGIYNAFLNWSYEIWFCVILEWQKSFSKVLGTVK